MIMQTRTHVAVGAVGVSAIVIALLYTHVVPLNVTRTVKVKFVIDKEYDALAIWWMLGSGTDPMGVRNRARWMGITSWELNRILEADSFEEVEEFITNIVEERHKQYERQLEEKLISYQESWDEIDDFFFAEVEEITGHRWSFDEYLVVVSPIHPGVSNMYNNTVVRWIFEDPIEQRRITAHEILMIHIWDIFNETGVFGFTRKDGTWEIEEIFSNYYEDPWEEWEKGHLWALNEITTIAILGLEPELNELWSPNTKGFSTETNYPQIVQLQLELKEAYLEKSDFQNYLNKAISILHANYSDQSFR